jgi:hypothetical protein
MFKMGKLLKGVKFFPQGPNFSAKLAGKVCQELATLVVHCVYSGGGGGTLTKPVLSVNSILYILRQESVIKYIAVFKVITGSNLCLFTALGFLWMF